MKAWEVKMEEEMLEAIRDSDIVRQLARIVYNTKYGRDRRTNLIKKAIVHEVCFAMEQHISIGGVNKYSKNPLTKRMWKEV